MPQGRQVLRGHVTVLPCSLGGRCELNLRSPCPTRPLKLVGIAVGGPAAICAAVRLSVRARSWSKQTGDA